MSLTANFVLLAQYNSQMNTNFYRAASQLSAEQLRQDRGAFFGSIINTLNHILVGDIVWLKRFSNHPENFSALTTISEFPSPTALNAIIYDQLSELQQQREQLDSIICRFTKQLTDHLLVTSLTYQNTKGIGFSKNFGLLMQHFFNHQTHHRGQLSTMLYQVGIDVGITDLLINIPDDE